MSVRSEVVAQLQEKAAELEQMMEDWPRRQVLQQPSDAVSEAVGILTDAASELASGPRPVRA